MRDLRTIDQEVKALREQLDELATRPAPAPSSPPVPTVGRIVHFGFVEPRGDVVARPAIIVRVNADSVNLQQFTDDSNDDEAERIAWRTSVKYSDQLEADRWTWPPR